MLRATKANVTYLLEALYLVDLKFGKSTLFNICTNVYEHQNNPLYCFVSLNKSARCVSKPFHREHSDGLRT